MKFSIQINTGPYTHQASDTAYQFTRAAIAAGHEIHRVFFYHDGVNNSTMFSVPPRDDRNIQQLWSTLAEQHSLDMVVCVAAAQRRGILDQKEADRHGKPASNIAKILTISGLGQLIEAAAVSDRLMVFGD
jgi:tRNA 2-thiouridine synthesizing protein D